MTAHLLCLLAGLLILPACLAGGGQRTARKYNLDQNALALSGYDPVAYFSVGGATPQKGSRSLQVDRNGALYRFASEANRELFLGDPERFEPRYGGWCAWAMIEGEQVGIDPESFLIEDGSLLLFYDGWLADTRKQWLELGGAQVRPKADERWAKLMAELTQALSAMEPK